MRSIEVLDRGVDANGNALLVLTDAAEEPDSTFILYEVLPGVWRETLTNLTLPG